MNGPKPYKVLLPVLVNGEYTQGDVFETAFEKPEDEAANVASGLIAIVPRTYKVVGSSEVFETKPGGTFTAALTMAQEQHLIDGGFIKLADEDSSELFALSLDDLKARAADAGVPEEELKKLRSKKAVVDAIAAVSNTETKE